MHSIERISEDLDLLCNEVLTAIEIQESRVLSWGFVDTRADLRNDFDDIITGLSTPAAEQWHQLTAQGMGLDEVIANLTRRRLLFKSGAAYRTRFAETVRLLYLLRQRFSERDWQTAKRLVSDLKIQLQRRRYPRRDVPIAELRSALQSRGIPRSEIEASERLLRGADGNPLMVARFQRQAIQEVLSALREGVDRAIAIGAGTGAGKTKAFYVPAFSWIASHQSEQRSIQALALYPRTELLKDQLVEAFAEARKLDALLAEQGKRPLVLAAYYMDTPTSAAAFLERPPVNWKWDGRLSGWICPYFYCPNPTCDERDLVWTKDDLERENRANRSGQYGRYTCLRCPQCHTVVTSEQLLLTREQMLRTPPDVLFTTTEMLNRRLSRTKEHALFGVDVVPAPRLLLLDEIHTYEGLSGAQVAYLLRRWRYARRRKPGEGLCLVGLSATLTNAETFLAKLSGMQPYQVEYISPSNDDMVEEGLEYNLVLKGDPVSGASLLSTSVQTLMLLGRMLDPVTPVQGIGASSISGVSDGVYGRRIFAFADNLDVNNRWYHIEQSAEKDLTLSQYRKRNPALSPLEQRRRVRAGQDWSICAEIGHDLDAPLRIDRVSSQSRGIRPDADVVIATSALEVGFNDLKVGAVVQHKAPRTMASFLQRKGRAGRTRLMRPWTVVITSAYGRDRWAFQHAENLFNPVLPPLELPLENIYVRKIQATFAFMDWLALELKRQHCDVDIWDALSGGKHDGAYLEWPRRLIAQIVSETLSGKWLGEVSRYLAGALNLAGEEGEHALQHILWNDPRSLLFDVLPTVLRQVESDWQRVAGPDIQKWSDAATNNPLPDFAPPNLFSDLNVPELMVRLPEQGRQKNSSAGGSSSAFAQGGRRALNSVYEPWGKGPESMQLLHGMTEFAPGRVSKRFAKSEWGAEAHWLPLQHPQMPGPRGHDSDTLPLESLPIELDEAPRYVRLGTDEIAVYRPRAYTLEQIPSNVLNTSNAWLRWRSHFHPSEQRKSDWASGQRRDAGTTSAPQAEEARDGSIGDSLPLNSGAAVRGLIRSATAYTQATGAWVDVTRLAVGVRAETRFKRGEALRTLFFTRDGTAAALGFSLSVDALAFDLAPFDPEGLRAQAHWTELYRRLGPQYFLSKLRADPRLAALSSFECGWLWQLSLSMVVTAAAARGCTLSEALEEVKGKRRAFADRAMSVIFQAQEADEDEEEQVGRLQQRIGGLLDDARITAALDEHIRVVWDAGDPGLDGWLRQWYTASAGATLFAAVTALVPDLDPDELIMDVDEDRVWISEASAGGVGIVSRIADALAQRPRDLELQLRDTLRNCDREEIGSQLHALAEWLGDDDPALVKAFGAIRTENTLPEVLNARDRLIRTLEQHGLAATRELVVAIVSKFLRPNSDEKSDHLIASLVKLWDATEERLGTVVDLRVMAVAALRMPEIDRRLNAVLEHVGGSDAQVDEAQKFNLLQSLLWLSCIDSCPDCIERRQPFQELLKPSRALLLAALNLNAQPTLYGEQGWEQRVQERLAHEFQALLSCEQEELEVCKRDALALLTQPVEVGYQLFYPLIERIERQGMHWLISMSIREMTDN